MHVIPFVHEGLGNSSYLVELDDGRALLVDPDRTAHRYLQVAETRDRRIVAVVETHLHADFVSGAREIAAAAGAVLFVPAQAHSRVAHHPIVAGQRLPYDGIEIEAIGSPGHTPEHLAYVFRAAGGPPALFSGGSLIVGGAARTDLIAPELTESLTRAQFRTLRSAFASLPDDTLLLPTHGSGSFCSTGGGERRQSTLGDERAHNPLLQFDDEDEFVRSFPATFPGTPDYYARMRAVNQRGARLRGDIDMPRPLSPRAFDALRPQAAVIDVRPNNVYPAAHVPRSISIPMRDAFCVWLGWMIPAEAALLFVTDGAPVNRVVNESLLVGYEHFGGWLDGGIDAWRDAGLPVAAAGLVDAAGARRALLDGAAALDVRELEEYAAGHIDGALHIPLGDLERRMRELPRDRPVLAYCGAGERASTAVSLLERAGQHAAMNLNGGIDAWRDARLPLAR